MIDRATLIRKTYALRRQHVGLGDDDEAWRSFLERVTGKRSITAMSEAQLGMLCDALSGRKAPPRRRRRTAERSGGRNMITEPQLDKLETLAAERGWEGMRDPRALAFVHRTAKVDDVRFLTNRQASAVITGLEKWLAGAPA